MSADSMWDGASLQGSFHENEDRWGSRGTWAWVVDGATNPLPAAGTAAAHAAAVSTAIDAAVARNPWAAPAAVLEQALGNPLLRATAGQSATVAIADRRGDLLRWLVLGDCSVTWTTAISTRSVTDDRLASIAVAERAAFSEAPVREKMHLRRTLVLAEQAWRNRPGGFWVAVADPRAAREAFTGVCRDVETVLLSTDGVRPPSAGDLRAWGLDLPGALSRAVNGGDDATVVFSPKRPSYGSSPPAE